MSTSVNKIPFDKIDLGENVRKDHGDMGQLVHSLKTEGLIEPLVVEQVRVDKETRYKLVAGFRRYDAIKQIKAGDKKAFPEVHVVVQRGNENDLAFVQLAENVVRKDLNPIELAEAIRAMVKREYTTADIGARVGLSKAWIDRLLLIREKCCAAVLKAVAKGELSVNNAYEFVDLDVEKQQAALAKTKEAKATKGGARAARKAAKKSAGKKVSPGKREVKKLAAVLDAHSFEGDYWRGVHDALLYTLEGSTVLIDQVEAEAERNGIDLNAEPADADADTGDAATPTENVEEGREDNEDNAPAEDSDGAAS